MKRIKLFEDMYVDPKGKLNQKEPIENLALLHKDAGYARLNQWQKENAKTPIEIGDWVKLAFIDNKKVEWMWVKVEKVIDADHIEGTLDNDPISVRNVKLGDDVKVERSQIAELMKKDE